MKRWLNRGLDALFVPGTERLWVRRLRGRVMVLVYHRVAESSDPGVLDRGGVPRITPSALHRELSLLVGLGGRIMTFRDLREGEFPSGKEFGVIVSFDDGFRDSYEYGLPVVESLGGKAVVFQCTAMLDNSGCLPEHRLYRLLFGESSSGGAEVRQGLADRLGLEWAGPSDDHTLVDAALRSVPLNALLEALDSLEDGSSNGLVDLYPDAHLLRTAQSRGHEVGSHGRWHLHRQTIGADLFEQELHDSRSCLEEILEQAPMAFSYPFGAVAMGDEQICGRYFEQAATCEREFVEPQSEPLALGRFSWPGPPHNALRERRWLLSGSI